jgi:circadian clock protein KaiC
VKEELNKSYMEEDIKKEILEKNRRQLSTKRSNLSVNGKKKN